MKFLDYMRSVRQCSESTVRNYEIALRRWYDFTRVYEADAREFVYSLVESGLSPSTVNQYIGILREYYSYQCSFEGCQSNPFVLIKRLREPKMLPNFVTRDVAVSIIDSLPSGSHYEATVKIAITIAFYGGLRVSELSNLKIEDVGLDSLFIKSGKGNKDRYVPLCQKASDAVREYMKKYAGRVYFMEFREGVAIGTRSYRRMFDFGLSSLQKDLRHPHMLRHSLATALVNNGMSLYSVAKMLGHASVKTTEIYTHLAYDDLKREYCEAISRSVG